MKKSIVLVLFAVLIVFAGCHKSSEGSKDQEKISLDDLSYGEVQKLKEDIKNEMNAENQSVDVSESAAKSPTLPKPVESVAPLHKSSSPGNCEFSFLRTEYLTHDDLVHCSGSELRVLRNAIYAMHGYIFDSPDLRAYFSQFSWYTPRSKNVENQFNAIEKANVKFIRSYE